MKRHNEIKSEVGALYVLHLMNTKMSIRAIRAKITTRVMSTAE
jgi:hypothetical protein